MHRDKVGLAWKMKEMLMRLKFHTWLLENGLTDAVEHAKDIGDVEQIYTPEMHATCTYTIRFVFHLSLFVSPDCRCMRVTRYVNV
jgi:hypothetical protein